MIKNSKKQMPDNVSSSPHYDIPVNLEAQLPKEISKRRKQRWFFYVIIILLVLGTLGAILVIYNNNTHLLLKLSGFEDEYNMMGKELSTTKTKLNEADSKISDIEISLAAKQKEIDDKAEEYKQVFFDKEKLEEKVNNLNLEKEDVNKSLEECSTNLSQTHANVFSLIAKLGVGISNADLGKIRLADANLEGEDNDGDGLSNLLEDALGTDKNSRDSDQDGFDDKSEILGSFNPLGSGNMPIDDNFAKKQAGKILLQVEHIGEAWYINPGDDKRYFLGNPEDALKVIIGIK